MVQIVARSALLFSWLHVISAHCYDVSLYATTTTTAATAMYVGEDITAALAGVREEPQGCLHEGRLEQLHPTSQHAEDRAGEAIG